MAKKTTKTKPTEKPSKPRHRTKSEPVVDNERHLNLTELAGDAYTIHHAGEPRRRHEDRVEDGRPQPIELEQKLMIIDNLLSKMISGVSCEEIDILAMHMTAWAAELIAVHRPEIPDEAIQGGKIVFPTQSTLHLLDEVNAFKERHRLTDQDVVDFLVQKMHGDTKQTATLN